MLRQIIYKYNIYTSTIHSPVQGTGTSRSGERVLADQRQAEARL